MNFHKQNLKRFAGLLALSALLLGSTDAQARGRGGCDGFLSQIELEDGQQDQIDLIREEAREERTGIFSDDDLDREAKRKALKALRKATREKIHQEVLTQDQRDEIEALKEARATERLNKRMERLTERLGLSDDQVTNIRGVFETARPKMQEIKESDASREEKREQFKIERDKMNTEILSFLDEEQQATFTKMTQRLRKRPGSRRARS